MNQASLIKELPGKEATEPSARPAQTTDIGVRSPIAPTDDSPSGGRGHRRGTTWRRTLLVSSPVLGIAAGVLCLQMLTAIYDRRYSRELAEFQTLQQQQADLMRMLLQTHYVAAHAATPQERTAATAKADETWRVYRQHAQRSAGIDRKRDEAFLGLGKFLRHWHGWLLD